MLLIMTAWDEQQVMMIMPCDVTFLYYLLVHGSHDGSADLHPKNKAALEVLLQEQRLEKSHHQQ